MRHKLFVYGTIKSGQRNHGLLGEARDTGLPAVAHGVVLHIQTNGLPFAVRGDGKIFGEVYQIDAQRLALLDRFEGHPHWYVRELISVTIANTRRIKAWIYLNPTEASRYPRAVDGHWPKK